jgi:FimV-like protein
MRRLLIFPILCWSILASAFDWKGPIAVSHQGEPLEVRLEVTNLGSVTPTQLFPLLASESAFTARGIDRPEYLSGLTYAVDSSNDRVELVIRTATAWTQPELTTLVEVFTPNGPALIPVSVGVGPKPVAKPKLAQESPKKIPVIKPKPPEVKVAVKAPESQVVQPKATQPKTLSVRNGSTLWRLAKRVQPKDLTIEQVMMALYDENPSAFEYNNVNALEKGKILNVPSVARMGQESALAAKQRFDAHMKAPKKDFPRTTRVESVAVEATPEKLSAQAKINSIETGPKVINETVVNASEAPAPAPAPAPEPEPEPEPAPAPAPAAEPEKPAPVVTKKDVAAEPQVVTVISPEVTELLEKITNLENKLDAVDAKVEAIANESQSNKSSSLPLPEPQVEVSQSESRDGWMPTRAEIEAFLGTEVGKGVLILVALSVLVLLGLRFFGGKTSVSDEPASVEAPRMPEPVEATVEQPQESPTPSYADNNSEALETAIERLKSKIEDPEKLKEAEELYSAGDDALIDAFSADALNQNPEWGEDPDDEADVASHQLELAQNYLDMGMTQTAIELLERVSVSPDQASAEKARALLDVHRS